MNKYILSMVYGLSIMAALMSGCKSGSERSSKTANSLRTPEDVVKAFCDLDGAGKRLSSLTWPEVLPYIAWKDEAGWDTVIVISGYKLTGVQSTKSGSHVTVEYSVVGESSRDFAILKSVEKVRFNLRKTGKGWKIESPDSLMPHVLAKPLIAHFEADNNHALADKLRAISKE